MTRSTLFSLGLVAVLSLTACSAVEAQRYPTPRQGGADYRPADTRYDNRRDDRRDSRYERRIERDVREFTRQLDREVRLNSNQERRIEQYLERQTSRLLRSVRDRDEHRVYPFPRQWRQTRYGTQALSNFWRSADGEIERILDRNQVQEYRYLTGRSRTRGTRDQRDRRDDRRDDRRRGRDRD